MGRGVMRVECSLWDGYSSSWGCHSEVLIARFPSRRFSCSLRQEWGDKWHETDLSTLMYHIIIGMTWSLIVIIKVLLFAFFYTLASVVVSLFPLSRDGPLRKEIAYLPQQPDLRIYRHNNLPISTLSRSLSYAISRPIKLCILC
jgi:hypothetical protein